LYYRAVALDQIERGGEAEEILQSLASKGGDKYADRARRHLQEKRGKVS
jgi:hypothetical protein